MVWGATLFQALAHVAFLAAYVVLPGWCALRVARRPRGDVLLELGTGAALGTALLALVFVLLQTFGLGWWIAAWPLASVPIVLALWTRGELLAFAKSDVKPAHVLVLLALACVAMLRPQLEHPSEWWYRFQLDTLFHAGNAAALTRELHFDNPRMAGLPFNYHVFGYAPFAIERLITGIPVEALFFRVAAHWLPVLLAVQVFNAARAIGKSALAGTIAAALVVLHVDPGEKLAAAFGPAFNVFNSLSFLELGIYFSTSTCAGLIALATLLVHLAAWIERGDPVELTLAVVLGAFASGAKGSVMPVVLAGLALTAIVARARGAPVRRIVVAGAVLAITALPMTLSLASGEQSYASSMFHVLPFGTLRRTDLAQRLAEALGHPPTVQPEWLVWCLAPIWIVLHLGLTGCVGFAAAWVRRRELGAVELLLVGIAVAGLAIANSVAAPGESQLFFAYNSSIALAILAGNALARLTLPKRLERVLLVGFGVPFAIGVAIEIGFRAYEDLRRLPPEPAELARYRETMEWIRTHVPADAVLVASRREILLSAHAERSCFYETDHYTPRWHTAGWEAAGDSPLWRQPDRLLYPDRKAIMRRVLEEQDPDALRAMRKEIGDARPIYVVFDRLRWRTVEGLGLRYVAAPAYALPEIDPSRFRLVHENDMARVCLAIE